MKLRAWSLSALAAAVLFACGPAAGAQDAPTGEVLRSQAADRTSVAVTVYNSDLALVREVRSVDLPRGEAVLEFRDVPAAIQPATLLVTGGDRVGLELLEQNYEFDLLSRQQVLEKYVGRPLAWIQEDGSRISGRLLGLNGGAVYEVDGEIQFEVPGRIVLPTLPENLRERPTLVWKLATARAGRAEIEASYLTGAMSWSADYVLQLDGKGEKADLQAWVTIENRSGASFPGAELLLVAGEINRATQPPMEVMMGAKSLDAAAGRAPAFSEETLYDYHLYTLERPTDLLDRQIKQISLYEAEGIRVKKKYTLRARPYYFRQGGFQREEGKVAVSYEVRNSRENELGVPLPAGVVRVYGRSEAGGRQLLGEDRIGHTPRDETLDLTVGEAFDVVAERVRTDFQRVAENLDRVSFRVTIRNHRDEPVTVEVFEPVGGDWRVIATTHPERRVSASELAFAVTAPKGGEAVLEYTVEIRR